MSYEKAYVLDSTVLINFEKIQKLNLLHDLMDIVPHTFICPEAVYEEVTQKSTTGNDTEKQLQDMQEKGNLERIRIDSLSALKFISDELDDFFGPGEAEALHVCMEHDVPLISDDRAARKYARKNGRKYTGTIGILFAMIDRELVTLDEAVDCHSEMDEKNYYTPYSDAEFREKYLERKQNDHLDDSS